jgi:pimeloyl-ACP methyl ester carboxylesterase
MVTIGKGPVVLLVHDWTDSSETMLPLAAELASQGYQAIRFDFPWPDQLTELEHASQMAEAVAAVAASAGPIAAVVAHGHGVPAVMLALSRNRFTHLAVLLGADAGHDLAPTLAEYLGDVHTLFIHSSSDAVASLHDALAWAEHWPNCVLARIDRIGHRQMLGSPAVHREVLRFVDQFGASSTLQ